MQWPHFFYINGKEGVYYQVDIHKFSIQGEFFQDEI